jgi:two-component system LytT family sensor kinase
VVSARGLVTLWPDHGVLRIYFREQDQPYPVPTHRHYYPFWIDFHPFIARTHPQARIAASHPAPEMVDAYRYRTGVVVLYNLANSAIVEWLRMYDPKIKVSVEKRFLANLILDSPLILVWVSIYYIWHYVELGTSSEIQKVKLESLVKELELKTIKSHINPHFIFNALNSIRALVDENPERARTAITELSNILRSSMQAEKLETVPFERELNIVKDYLALEHIRFEDRLRVEYDIDEDTLDQPVPPMMLQTLVENAIKHGIGKQKDGGQIKVISDYRDNHHELIVLNSGTLNGSTAAGDGFGLNSTRNRLKLLFGERATFAIRNTDNQMVEAKVKMPVQFAHS